MWKYNLACPVLYHLDELHYIFLPALFAKMDLRHGNIGGIHLVNRTPQAEGIHRDYTVQRFLFLCNDRQMTGSFERGR